VLPQLAAGVSSVVYAFATQKSSRSVAKSALLLSENLILLIAEKLGEWDFFFKLERERVYSCFLMSKVREMFAFFSSF
jgi:hypothetical protein